MKLKLGVGKYQIDPVVYYSKLLYVFKKPGWFFKNFYPKIPVEVLYTMNAVLLVGGSVLNFLVGLTGGYFNPLQIVRSILIGLIILPIALLISTVFLYVMNILISPVERGFGEMWKMACFGMTVSGLLLCLQSSAKLAVVLVVLISIVSMVFWFNVVKYYFRASKLTRGLYIGFCAISLVFSVTSLIALKNLETHLKKDSSSASRFFKEIEKIQKNLPKK